MYKNEFSPINKTCSYIIGRGCRNNKAKSVELNYHGSLFDFTLTLETAVERQPSFLKVLSNATAVLNGSKANNILTAT